MHGCGLFTKAYIFLEILFLFNLSYLCSTPIHHSKHLWAQGDVQNSTLYIKVYGIIHKPIIIPTGDFLLIIIVVTGGEELSKDESRHIDFLHLVLHYWNALPIIPYTDAVVLAKMKTHSTQIFHHTLL